MPRRSSNRSVQRFSSVENKTVVAHSDETRRGGVHHPPRSQQKTISAVGSISVSPNGEQVTTDFCKFVGSLLQRVGMPAPQADFISANAWRQGTLTEKKGMVKYWKAFCQENQKNLYDMSFAQMMSFLDYLREKTGKFYVIKRGKDFFTVIRKLIGKPLSVSQRFLVDKYTAAAFNIHPSNIIRQTSTWDVNILLDFFVKLGPNEKIPKVNTLAGKLAL